MNIEHSNENQVEVIKLTGRLTAANTKNLRAGLKVASKKAPANLVLDIAELTFVDSTGLGVLAGWLQKVRAEKGDIVLLSPRPEIKVLLELTRLDQVFPIHSDRTEAVRSFH